MTLEEDVYMQQLSSFEDNKHPHLVCKLHKALYGLKEAHRARFDKLKASLYKRGFPCCKANISLLFRFTKTACILILVYVGDNTLSSLEFTQKEIMDVIGHLNNMFSSKDIGPFDFLMGIQVTQSH